MEKQIDGEDLRHLFACTFLFHFAVYMVLPAITDVTMDALCPGQDHCSLAIYLSGVHQAVSGLGALVVTPLVGNWSDKYGRKALLSLPMTAAIIPLVVLSSGRSKPYFYAYYVVKMLTAMFCEGSMQCLTLAYVADRVCVGKRASAFGVLSGISLAGFVSGTLVARFLPTSYTFQVSASVAGFAALYMKIFLAETDGGASLADEESTLPLCSGEGEPPPKLPALRNIPASSDMIAFLRSSITLTRAAIVAFFTNLANSGYQAVLLYYLKAKFQFNKDQFADLMLIVGCLGATSQLLLMPLLAPVIGEERLLIIGLLASCTHIFLYGVAWSYWVPYFAAAFAALSVLVDPSLRSIVSKKVGPAEQGMAQGCVTGVASFASILAPFVFTPLTALFLSDNAPFSFKGFSVTCAGFISLVAFSLSMTLSKKTMST
ncbi:hippocampus abundant transcript-like protein 1 [Zingiber officinale]|uniref:hippocampus abundant transcript-like protein 1 n=1 Tax=Zingiber officinale TaxID=94328 RepID=UPI001C4ADFA5|nr:hippocampus abundant transcript-like protein 1 [Zingiber officinale]